MDIDSMTPQQLRELADKKEKDDENKIIKVGYLKMDLYSFESDHYSKILFAEDWGDFWLKTNEEMLAIIESFKEKFKLVLPKGSKFVCYHYDDQDFWFDDENVGVEQVDNNWAEKYLENISIVVDEVK